MRQLIVGGNVAYASGSDLSAVAEGAVGVFINKAGALAVSADGTDVTDKAMLVLGRAAKNGGPIVIPIHKNKFSFVKGTYQAAKTFSGSITVPEPTAIGTYSVIIVKKGLHFNQRSNFTASIYVKDLSIGANGLATALAKEINNNSIASGVTAEDSEATITITATESGVDYNIIPADELQGLEVTITTIGQEAYGDAKHIVKLANMAAADAGFEYTYSDGLRELYPNYPYNPLEQPDKADTGFTIFTLKFAEPRDVKTVDEVVNQIVQVAFPTGAGQIATFETVCKAIAGIA